MKGTPAWQEPGWLPELEIVKWPRLQANRAAHEKAVAALKGGDGKPGRYEALSALCEVVEAAHADLRDHWPEGEAALAEAAESAKPKPSTPPRGAVGVEADEKRVAAEHRREAEERTKLAPRLKAAGRDRDALAHVYNSIIEGNQVLHAGQFMRRVPAEVAEVRDRMELATV